ncbi:MAG: hypothetical protein ABSA11_04050 [Candidatus Bathyarchaeia archaeon]|jgi:hypothetical protein
MLPYPDLFVWWAGTITFGILFIVCVSAVLYLLSKKKVVASTSIVNGLILTAKNYAFVWVLLTLLVLYLVSIDGQNYLMFAAGNVVIEVLVFGYLLATRKTYQG